MDAIADLQTELICQYDQNLRLTYVNRAYSDWLRIPKDRLIDTDFLNLIPTEERAMALDHVRSLTAERPTAVSIHQTLLPDGTRRTIEWTDRALFDNNGYLTGYLGVGRDVTERETQVEQILTLKNQLAAVLDTIQDAIMSVSLPDRQLLYASASIEKIFGYPTERLLSSFNQLVHPDDLEQVICAQQTCLREGFVEFEHRILWPDGQVRWLERRAWVSYITAGHPVRLTDIARDITGRKQAELARQESSQTFQLFIEHVPAAIAMFDRDMRYLAVSRRWLADYGLPDQNFIGRSYYEVFPEIPERIRETHRRCLAGAVATGDADRIRRADGVIDWVHWEIRPWHDRQGEIGGILLFSEIITARKEAEDALRSSETRYRQMFEVNGLPKLISDPSTGQIVDANPAAAEYYGYDLHVLKTMKISDINQSPQAEIKAKMADATAHRLSALHLKHRLADGTIRDAEVFSGPINHDGRQLLYSTITDITEREKAKAALEEANNRLEKLVNERTADLEKADNRLAAIFNHSGDGLMLLNTRQGIQQANHTFEMLFAAQPVEYLGKKLDAFLQPENSAALEEVIQEVATTHRKQEFEARTLTGIEVEISLAPVNRSSQLVTNLVCIIRDITERKQAEETLRESEARFRLLAENVTDVILRTQAGQEIIFITPSCYPLLGYRPEELIGTTTGSHIHPEDWETGRHIFGEALSNREPSFRLLQRVLHKDGHYIPIEVNNTIIYDPVTGQFQETISVIRDITERKQAEEALRESEARFRLIAENVTDVIVRFTPDSTCTYITPSIYATLGYTPEELIGKPVSALVHPDDWPLVSQTSNAAVSTNAPSYTLSHRVRRKDGQYDWTESTNTIIRDHLTGQPLERISVFRDITKRRQAEEALRQALEKEKELGELKTRFVSMASHEFRTPLASILAITETLTNYRERMDEGQINTRLGKIRQQVKHLTQIMDDVLQQARIQAGRVEYKPSPGDLDAFCRDIIEEYETQPGNQGRLNYKCPNLPVTASYDLHLMRQIISNLLSNALKYSPVERQVYVTLTRNETFLVFQVSDRGIGIPPEDMGHLFEPFHRASNVGNISGTGLGLNITRQAVLLHGGTITAESKPDQGAIFTITLPLSPQSTD